MYQVSALLKNTPVQALKTAKMQKCLFTSESESALYFLLQSVKKEDICPRQFDVETLFFTVAIRNYLQYSIYIIYNRRSKTDTIFLTTTKEQSAKNPDQASGLP